MAEIRCNMRNCSSTTRRDFKDITRSNKSRSGFLGPDPEIYFLISELQIQSPFYVYLIPCSLKRRASRHTSPMIHRYSVQGSTGLVCCEYYESKRNEERERMGKSESERGGIWRKRVQLELVFSTHQSFPHGVLRTLLLKVQMAQSNRSSTHVFFPIVSCILFLIVFRINHEKCLE